MNEFLLYVAVFIGAATPAIEVWAAVPLSVLAGLPWLPTVLVGFTGNFVTLLPVIYAGEKIKVWVKHWRKKPLPEAADDSDSPNVKESRKQKIFNRYGVPGLAILGPFLIGVHVASAFAMASGANRRAVIFWFSISIFVCAFLSGLLAEIGITNFSGDLSLPFQD